MPGNKVFGQTVGGQRWMSGKLVDSGSVSKVVSDRRRISEWARGGCILIVFEI